MIAPSERKAALQKPYIHHVLPCAGSRCSAELGEEFRQRLKELCPDRKELGVRISSSSCQGMCKLGPNLIVYPEGVVYHGVQVQDLDEIVEQHLRRGQPVERLMREPDGDNLGDSEGVNPPKD